MSDYSYNDMLKMQSEAKKRVMEMQKRSKYVAESFNGGNKAQKQEENEELPRIPRAISLPAELNTSSRNIHRTETRANAANRIDVRKSLFSVFGNLGEDDYEKMFILSLCLLLMKENSDDSLIMALMYLLS